MAVIQNLRFGVDGIGEDDLLRLELQRVEQAAKEGAHLRTAITRVGVGRVSVGAFTTRGVVKLECRRALRATHDGVLRRVLTEVNSRFVLAQILRNRDTRLEELRLSILRALVTEGRNQAVTVGVDDGVVVPGL